MISSATALPNLQPLRLGELLDRAIRLYRKNFLTFIGIIALAQVPPVVVQTIVSILTFGPTLGQISADQPPTDPFAMFTPAYWLGQLATLVVSIISFYLLSIGRAAIMRVAADSYLFDRPTTILGAFGKIGRSWLSLLLSLTLILIVGIAVFIWWIVPCVGWFSGVGMFMYGSWVIYPLVVACCVLEGQGAFGSLRRAWDLARRRFWWTIGFMFMLFVFGIAVTAGPSVVMGSALSVLFNADIFADNPEAVFVLQTIVQSITTLAISVLYMPIQMVSEVVMYFDLRVRTEGLDLALSTAGAGGSDSDVTAVLAQAPRPESGRPITAKEFGYFVLLSLVVLLPIILIYIFLIAIIFMIALAMPGG
ncbi:MAG TPA: hypothetical protein VI547_13480 [Anaerolineales bacterium]|nr:hypothetical protein [Anaerolineales bacterium]